MKLNYSISKCSIGIPFLPLFGACCGDSEEATSVLKDILSSGLHGDMFRSVKSPDRRFLQGEGPAEYSERLSAEELQATGRREQQLLEELSLELANCAASDFGFS